MSNPKVFEFAKEVGMTPLALMDKIREWQLPIKSHMAELEPDILIELKTKLSDKSFVKSEKEKKPVAKKKKATAEPSAKAAAAKAPSKTAKKTPAKSEDKAVAAKATGTVVRRKMKTAEPEKTEEILTATEAGEAPVEEIASIEQPIIAQARVEEIKEAIVEKAPTEVAAVTEVTVAPQVVIEKKLVSRKKEVAIGNSGVESTPSSATPKRNIIGRMDLSRVSNQNVQSQERGSTQRAPVGGAQNVRPRPAGNIRAGFVQQAPVIPEIFDDTDQLGKKKDEKRRNKGGAGAEGSVKPAGEGQSKSFDAAEFRKREMVFQPKKKKGLLSRPAMQTQITKPDVSKRVVKVNDNMKLGDVAIEMKVKANDLIRALMKSGVMANINTNLDFDTISLIAPEFGYEAQSVKKTAEDLLVETAFGDLNAERITRPPVVTVMGHVDHGKTSLLDAIRNADVASKEAGGITQHIGAYQVKLEGGQLITFLDTPGHEAFTAMRARGANVTDIAIIVVAADDGVMPQTAEAINHAKAAKVPMIVAVNKIDKPGANTEKIKQQLTEYEVVPEEWGGTTIFSEVSALKKTGIKELLEKILLVAEVQELKANPKRSGTGTVIESRLEKGRGNVATILIQDGTVKVGQFIVAGTVTGRIRSLMNDRGEKIDEAGPGMPVEVLGLDGTASAGDKFDTVKDEKSAELVARIRKEKEISEMAPQAKVTLEDLFSKVAKGDVKELGIVLKTDVAGSLEAIQGMFGKLSTAEVKVKIIHSAVGGVTENDVLLASTSNGIVIGFGVRPDSGAQTQAKRRGVEIRTYSVVYEMIDDMKKAMIGLLQPDIVEKVMGHAEVRNVFNVPKIGAIAGCFVQDGKIQRSHQARLLRDGKIIYEGKISSLKRFKDDAKEVAQGFECGIGIENFNDVKPGDMIEAFIKEEVAKELSAPLNP